ncbi:MAG: tetratricopeptide repeat protein, partial [Candidatus Heimdallarchaeaceae archaeon]
MKQRNAKSLDKVIKNSTELLNVITSELIAESVKIYACYPPGEIIGSLFEFKDTQFFRNFKRNFNSLKPILIENLDRLPYENVTEILILGNLFAELNEIDVACQIYEKLLKHDESNFYAWSNLLTLYLKQGDYKRAIDCYLYLPPEFVQMAIKEKTNPELDAYRLLNISSVYPIHESLLSLTAKSGISRDIKNEFERELRILYSYTEFAKGQEALANDSVDEALIYFSSVVAKRPESDVLWYFMGKTALDGGHFVITEEYLKKAIKLKNNIPEYWIVLANCFFAQHKNEQGTKALKTALTLDPTNQQCWLTAGKMVTVIESLGEYDHFIKKL